MLFALLESLTAGATAGSMIDLIGRALARVIDDCRRNRASAKRVAQLDGDDRIGLIH